MFWSTKETPRFEHLGVQAAKVRKVSKVGSQVPKLQSGFDLRHERGCSADEWIDDADTGIHEITTVSRRDCQSVNDRRCRDEAILNRHGFPGCPKTRQQFRPLQTCLGVPRHTVKTAGPCVEPAFQRCPLPALGKDRNSESQFTENNRINGHVLFMDAKPFHDTRIGNRFRRLAQNSGIDQVFHSESVDPESMGTKKSF